MSEPLRLVVNAKERILDEVAEPAMLNVVLAALALREDRIAVELNGELATRSLWSQTPVRSGDKLEIVHFVGGGTATAPAGTNC